MLLGVNIDHIAVLREARLVNDPSPLDALFVSKKAGADQITIHLREDRRHIHDDDALDIIRLSQLPVNLECSIDDEIIKIVKKLKPFRATLVPEKREEVTTEGGLDVVANLKKIKEITKDLQKNQIKVSLFVDPELKTIEASKESNADMIELHTGRYANIYAMLYTNISRTRYAIKEFDKPRDELEKLLKDEIDRLALAAKKAHEIGLEVAAGHGLNYQNVEIFKSIPHIKELNIGQSIIARSVYSGLENAIKEMKSLI